jgi:hypothetical protein
LDEPGLVGEHDGLRAVVDPSLEKMRATCVLMVASPTTSSLAISVFESATFSARGGGLSDRHPTGAKP